MMRTLTAALIGSTMLAGAAFAQSTTTTTTMPAASTTAMNADSSYTGNWRTSKVVGLNVYNDGNESLGTINDLLTDRSGAIKAAVIGVGGFLGVGERYVAIPFEKVKFSTEPVKSNSTAATGMGVRPTGTTTGAATGTTTSTMPTTGTMATPAATAPNPWYPDHAVVSATKDELKALPEFKYTTN